MYARRNLSVFSFDLSQSARISRGALTVAAAAAAVVDVTLTFSTAKGTPTFPAFSPIARPTSGILFWRETLDGRTNAARGSARLANPLAGV